MRRLSRKWRWIGLSLVLFLGVGFVAVRTWVVPAILRREIRANYKGRVVFRDWHFGLHSSGVDGVEVYESYAPDAPLWFKADRVSTDVSIARLLHGRAMPGRIEVDRPVVEFRLDANGQPLTFIPVAADESKKSQDKPVPIPEVVAKDGTITIAQEGRKPMTIAGVDARLEPGRDGPTIDVKTDDPTWGRVTVTGHFDPTFRDGGLQIASSPGFVADPAKLERIPFIPKEVWANIEPRGPVDARVDITLAAESKTPVKVHTELTLKGAEAKLETLQVAAAETRGRVVIDDALVKVENLEGKTLGGSIAAGGTLDFGQKVPRIDLDLRLRGIEVARAPASWQLGEVSKTGRVSGRVDLKVLLDPNGIDLAGTTGRAILENGDYQGIPVKSISLGMTARGNDLSYGKLAEGLVDKAMIEGAPTVPSASSGGLAGTLSQDKILGTAMAVVPLVRIVTGNRGLLTSLADIVWSLVSYESKHATGKLGGFRLPRTVSTRIELEDVDLALIVKKAEGYGVKVPVPVSGRLSIKAEATIPLGSLRSLKDYNFKGDATLKDASIDHVDLGVVSAHLDLADGILDLSDFRGALLDRPDDRKTDDVPAPEVPKVGPLPKGGFRGKVRASLAPKGPATASFEGEQLPLGELFAPVLPVPTPVSGELTLRLRANADVAKLSDPKSWTLDGHLDSRMIRYQDARLDAVTVDAKVGDGRLDVREFSALLFGKPLRADGRLDLAPPFRYSGKVEVSGWEIAKVLAFVPGAPKPAPASGVVDAKGSATGTIRPFAIETEGTARVSKVEARSIPLGDLDFRWSTGPDAVTIDGLELVAFGGKLSGGAKIPTRPGRPLEATANLKGVDVGRAAGVANLGPNLAVEGRVDGHVKLSMPADASKLDADGRLTSSGLVVRSGGRAIRASALTVSAVARGGSVDYSATAETLGARVRFVGKLPIGGDLSRPDAAAEVQVVGFQLADVWQTLGIQGGPARLGGRGAVDANLRASIVPFRAWARGAVEFRDLRLGPNLPLGRVRGDVAYSPTAWRLEDVEGDLFGGVVGGWARGETRPDGTKRAAFDLRIDRASLARMASGVPSLAREVEGVGSLRLTGQVADTLQATAEISVPNARALGLPISDLRFPAEVDLDPNSGSGTITARSWTARVAGGSIRGTGRFRVGQDHTFQSEVHLANVDLDVLTRSPAFGAGKKPSTGKVSGKVALSGPDPEQLAKIRGRVDLDLDDASLVELPLFKELDRFLGSARGGGLFEDGDLHATIYNRTLFVEPLTLEGKLLQIHATGTVTFDGALNLEVLANTNQIIPQAGLAAVNAIPGLGNAIGRGEEAVMRIAAFLENRLLKFRVTGTTSNPVVQLDPGVAVGDTAVGFFSTLFKPPGR